MPRAARAQKDTPTAFDAGAVLNALADPVFTVDAEDRFGYLNNAAEQFLQSSAHAMVGRALSSVFPEDSPLQDLVRQAREGAATVSQYGVTLEAQRFGQRYVSIDVAPIPEMPSSVAVALQEAFPCTTY